MLKSREQIDRIFNCPENYKILDCVGQGAYGIVVAAKDTSKNDELVAIKKMEKTFEHTVFTKRAIREIVLLRLLHHENIISVNTIFQPKRTNYEDLYLVTPLMESDLSNIIKSPQPLSVEHIQFFMYQLLRGLKYLHSTGVIHRDLKPRNLLVNSNCDLKICDFGLARVLRSSRKTYMTDYVATRWYRAPELILSSRSYSKAVDMWSCGCILAELLGRKAVFPGSDSQHQLQLIVSKLGTPTNDELMAYVKQPKARMYMMRMPARPKVPWSQIYPDAQPLALDLLDKLLTFFPENRFSVQEALEHPFMKAYHSDEYEPVGRPIDPHLFDFEFMDLSVDDHRRLILFEVQYYHKKKFIDKHGNLLNPEPEPTKAELELEKKKGKSSARHHGHRHKKHREKPTKQSSSKSVNAKPKYEENGKLIEESENHTRKSMGARPSGPEIERYKSEQKKIREQKKADMRKLRSSDVSRRAAGSQTSQGSHTSVESTITQASVIGMTDLEDNASIHSNMSTITKGSNNSTSSRPRSGKMSARRNERLSTPSKGALPKSHFSTQSLAKNMSKVRLGKVKKSPAKEDHLPALPVSGRPTTGRSGPMGNILGSGTTGRSMSSSASKRVLALDASASEQISARAVSNSLNRPGTGRKMM
eukprot:TRINITY_DN14495_c1_g1_i1.p1 TRINITY_DN14495_c1_g1~~TRINITY_DN14495_c1_g1_i1.p1  ORF type:complete len:681 (-),score=209.09 TRINITY_DN14495_c1_g1_i1:338-2275(-)